MIFELSSRRDECVEAFRKHFLSLFVRARLIFFPSIFFILLYSRIHFDPPVLFFLINISSCFQSFLLNEILIIDPYPSLYNIWLLLFFVLGSIG